MKIIGAYEAKTHFAQLLNAVIAGETVVITRHGEEIAHLVPAKGADKEKVKQAIENIKRARVGLTLGDDMTIEEMKNEGRA